MGRTELAQRYFPYILPKSAWEKLKALLLEDPALQHLATLRRRTFLPAEVNIIYQHLGQPWLPFFSAFQALRVPSLRTPIPQPRNSEFAGLKLPVPLLFISKGHRPYMRVNYFDNNGPTAQRATRATLRFSLFAFKHHLYYLYIILYYNIILYINNYSKLLPHHSIFLMLRGCAVAPPTGV